MNMAGQNENKTSSGSKAVAKLSSKDTNTAGCIRKHPANSNDVPCYHANIDFADWGTPSGSIFALSYFKVKKRDLAKSACIIFAIVFYWKPVTLR